MNNQTVRIKTQIGDKNLKVYLNNKYSAIDILSLKLNQNEFYQSDTSDFGVVVGRVQNNGVGIPNCKISIFVPLEDNESDPIRAIYPFTSINDKDQFENPYNLLPKYRESNEYNNEENGGYGTNIFGLGYTPDTPLGTFPIKDELTSNDILIEVFKKYYKYTTVTNDSGDYVLMGVPLGEQTIHLSIDLTDIGRFSMKPIVLSRLLGYPSELFTNNGTKIKQDVDLNRSPHIVRRNQSINVIPFWGLENVNDETREIGITRSDFDISSVEILPTTTIFSAGFTQPSNSFWYDYVIFRLQIRTTKFKVGPVTIGKFPSLGFDFSSNTCSINGGKYDIAPFFIELRLDRTDGKNNFIEPNESPDEFIGEGELTEKIDLVNFRNEEFLVRLLNHNPEFEQPLEVPENDYVLFKEDGLFTAIIPCDSRRKVTNERGELIDAPDDGSGLPTEFNGSLQVRMEGDVDNPPTILLVGRLWFKIPSTIKYEEDEYDNWLNEFQTFEFSKIYSIAQKWGGRTGDNRFDDYGNTGMIREIKLDQDNLFGIDNNNKDHIADKFVHFCMFFPQYARKGRGRKQYCDYLVADHKVNFNPIGGGQFNTKDLARADNFPTQFVEVNKKDFTDMLSECKKSDYSKTFIGNYIQEDSTFDNIQYTNTGIIWYKGLVEVNVFNYLLLNNLI